MLVRDCGSNPARVRPPTARVTVYMCQTQRRLTSVARSSCTLGCHLRVKWARMSLQKSWRWANRVTKISEFWGEFFGIGTGFSTRDREPFSCRRIACGGPCHGRPTCCHEHGHHLLSCGHQKRDCLPSLSPLATSTCQ